MADFTSKFWEWYIFILVGLSFAFCFALIIWMQRGKKPAKQKYGPLSEKHRTQDIRLVAANPEALKIGQRLYMTYCTACHGSDAGGGPGVPQPPHQGWRYGGRAGKDKSV